MTKQVNVLIFMILLALPGCKQEAPNSLIFRDLKGNIHTLKNPKASWTFINYWAEWCTPCLHEIPALNTLYETRKSTIRVFGVYFDEVSREDLETLANKYQIQYPLLVQRPEETLEVRLTGVLPTTLVLDKWGRVVDTLLGAQTLEMLNQWIDNHAQ